MILNDTPTDTAVLGGVVSQGEFRIRQSAKAFSILSDSLYQNKIRAIIRELCCNAYDSHVAAGIPREPFEVHLPCALEPWFHVRDHGVGLSHDQVIKIYTTYFESTKTGSNEYVGALGLGSKSPFCYQSNFTVTAIQNGRRGIYTAFVNDDGIPNIALMSEDHCEEPNGVEVRFAVTKSDDFHAFKHEAATVLTWFQTHPKITGCNLEILRVEFAQRDIAPGIHRYDYQYGSTSVVMGNICYPITNFPDKLNTLGDLAWVLDHDFVFEFPIGALDFQPSREGLSYTPRTISALKARFSDLNAALPIYLLKELTNQPSRYEKLVYWNSNRSRYSSQLRTIRNQIPEFDGIDGIDWLSFVCRGERIYPDQYKHIVVDDLSVGGVSRIKRAAKESKIGGYYLFKAKTSDDITGLLLDLGSPAPSRVIYTSDLPEPVKKVRSKVQSRAVISHWYNRSIFDISKLKTGNHYYIPVRGSVAQGRCFKQPGHTGYLGFCQLVTNLKLLEESDIWLVDDQGLKEVQYLKNWYNVDELVWPKISCMDWLVSNSLPRWVRVVILSDDPRIRKNHILSKSLNKVSKSLNKVSNNYENDLLIKAIMKYSGIKEAEFNSKLRKFKEQLETRYPLMNQMSTYKIQVEPIIEYITLIDQKRKTK